MRKEDFKNNYNKGRKKARELWLRRTNSKLMELSGEPIVIGMTTS